MSDSKTENKAEPKKRIFYINSRNKLEGTHSDFTYQLDLKGLNASHAALLAAYIPKSYYSVPNGKNTFTLEEDKKQVTISITAGSYTKSSIKSHLATQLNTSSPNGWSYSITTPSTTTQAETGKLTFTVSGNGGIQPKFIFGSYLWEQLGFEKETTYDFASNSLTSANVINLQAEQTLFIHSDLIQSHDNVLQEIYASNTLNYSGISFTNQNVQYYMKPLRSKDSNSYRFYLTDEDSNPIDLNGLNLVMTLLVTNN